MGKDEKKDKKAKKSGKDEKHSKHSKHSKEDKLKNADRDKGSDREGESGVGKRSEESSVEKPISPDDFFLKNEEFRVWLRLTKKKSFEDFSSEKLHDYFDSQFVKDYNRGKLESMFYDEKGLSADVRDQSMKTKHKWNFRISEKEQQVVSDVAFEVNKKTRVKTDGAWVHMSVRPASDNAAAFCSTSSASSARVIVGPTRPPQQTNSSDSRQSSSSTSYEKSNQSKSQLKASSQELLEEGGFIGGGRMESAMQKRQSISQATHAASRKKEDDKDGLDLPESMTMGGDGESFESVKARMNKRQNGRAAELIERDNERTNSFMQQLGVDFTKGKIVIQPRTN